MCTSFKQWTQGPALLQTLNILENFDLKSMGTIQPDTFHTFIKAMKPRFFAEP